MILPENSLTLIEDPIFVELLTFGELTSLPTAAVEPLLLVTSLSSLIPRSAATPVGGGGDDGGDMD
jgi:hypothetical protein